MRVFLVLIFSLLLCLLPNNTVATTTESQCLATVIYHESRGQSELDKFAVGSVVINRVKSKVFPKTICKVVYQPGQFSWVGRRSAIKDRKEYSEALRVAGKITSGQKADVTNGATYFHNHSVKPRWSRKMEVTLRTKAHNYLKI